MKNCHETNIGIHISITGKINTGYPQATESGHTLVWQIIKRYAAKILQAIYSLQW